MPRRPIRDDGSSVDATFEVSSVPVFEVVYHHKAGGRDSPRSVNADYHEGLELLLTRLSSVGCSILGIAVDSSVARELPPADRELDLPFPIEVSPSTDPLKLRHAITKAQKPVARRSDAKPGGGNDQKRIRITLALNQELTFKELLKLLSIGHPYA